MRGKRDAYLGGVRNQLGRFQQRYFHGEKNGGALYEKTWLRTSRFSGEKSDWRSKGPERKEKDLLKKELSTGNLKERPVKEKTIQNLG